MSDADIVRVMNELLGPVSGVFALLLLVGLAGLGYYLRRYLEQKAVNLATHEDFEKLQDQVAESTRLVEGIKSELANEDWVRRELHGLRVRKIEELVTLALNCEEDISAHRNTLMGGTFCDKPTHHDRMLAVAVVFLPELEPMTRAYRLALLNHYQLLGRKFLEASRGGGHEVWNDFMEQSNYREVIVTLETLTSEAAKLLQETANGTVFRQAGQDG